MSELQKAVRGVEADRNTYNRSVHMYLDAQLDLFISSTSFHCDRSSCLERSSCLSIARPPKSEMCLVREVDATDFDSAIRDSEVAKALWANETTGRRNITYDRSQSMRFSVASEADILTYHMLWRTEPMRIYPLRGAAGASGASELLLLVALEGEYITDLLLLGWRRILVEERGQGCRCLGAEMERGEDGGGGDIVLGLSCLSTPKRQKYFTSYNYEYLIDGGFKTGTVILLTSLGCERDEKGFDIWGQTREVSIEFSKYVTGTPT
ncbi:hypothetical protein Tco_0058090 [Tanacetum coccineum]